MQRDGSSKEDARSRVNSQMPISSKLSYADVVIDNSGTRSELDAHVQSLIHTLEASVGWTWRVSWLIPPFGFLSAVGSVLWRRFARRRKQKQD
jgi:dephospho-CoA kinase